MSVRLDDLQIERYSRQIVLREVGAVGQARLLDARVAVAGTGAAAERVLGYLAAAGVGRLAAPAALHDAVDPGQRDVTLEDMRAGAASAPVDVLVDGRDDADGTDAGFLPPARRTFWILAGRAAEVPPCPACAVTVLPPLAAPPAELTGVRDALLGTVVATEVVKALLEIGTPLRGHVLSYDATDASITTAAVAARPGCVTCAPSVAKR